MPTTEELTRAEIESVNEAAGLLRDRLVRLQNLMSEQDRPTEGVEKALRLTQEYIEERMPRIIRKSRDKMGFDDNLKASMIKEASIE